MGAALPSDYDTDPDRWAANQVAVQRFSRRGDVHSAIARRLAAQGCRTVIDIGGGIGGGNGTRARHDRLGPHGP